jgi:methylenetetrahydrofolate dehydrogenase (NADP+)/methenyltetrahydrofolate cyclohydrolase
MAIILNGRETSAKVMEEVEVEVKKLVEKGVTPGLGLVLTGTDRYSDRYVRLKKKES